MSSSAFGQSARCTDTPRPRVTKPKILSPGTGLQQRDRRTSTSSTPFTTMPFELCASRRFGETTLVIMGGMTPGLVSDCPSAPARDSSFPSSTSSFNRRLPTCCGLSFPVPMFTSMSSGLL